MISPSQLKALLPVHPEIERFVHESRDNIKQLLHYKKHQIAFVLGPCSVHSTQGIIDYAKRLKDLSNSLDENIFIVMRTYIEKSRTQTGWRGLAYDPFLDGSNDLETGVKMARELLIEISHLYIPIAIEIVDPLMFSYFDDLVSWGFIGARTVSSAVHRQFVSQMTIPVGFKNSLDGDTLIALQSIETSRHPHRCLGCNPEGQLSTISSKGNPFTHIVLRGGAEHPNYTSRSIQKVLHEQASHEIHSRILVDCAHGNSQKIAENQVACFENVLEQIVEGSAPIMGMMLESYTKRGRQQITIGSSFIDPDLSVTDPCLDFETTERLLIRASERLPMSIRR